MAAKVEVGAAMYAFQLFEAEREVKLYVCCGVSVVCEFLMVVEAIVFGWDAE